MKLLLGATIALLLGALAVSWQGMKNGVNDTPKDEIARLEKQVKELRAEHDKIQMEKQIQQLRNTTTQEPPAPNAEVEAMKAQLAQAQQELEDAARAERDKKVAQDEEGLDAQRNLESKDTELRRARMIAQSLVIGKVKNVDYAESGGFITFEVIMPGQVQNGSILAIRRKTGILGNLMVSAVEGGEAIANPMPGFGPVKPAIGDELILPPQY